MRTHTCTAILQVLGGAPFDDAGIAVPIDLCSCLIFLSLLRLHGCPEPLLWAAVDVAASLAASVLPLAMGHNVHSWGAVSANARQQAGTVRHVTNTQHRAGECRHTLHAHPWLLPPYAAAQSN